MAAVPGLLETRERLVMQLGNARRGDVEDARDFAEGDVLQVVEHDDGELRFGQVVEAAQDGAAILGGEDGGVGTGRGGIGEALREREALVALRVFGHVIKRDDLPGLRLVLVFGQVGFLDAQGGGQLEPGGFSLELLG